MDGSLTVPVEEHETHTMFYKSPTLNIQDECEKPQQQIKVNTFSQKQSYGVRYSGKGLNPIKEGLSINTLKILKTWLKILKDKHLKAIGEVISNNSNFYFIPTICVLDEMKTFLLVQEQINSILFGVTYRKNEEFFLSDKFDELIECLVEYDTQDLIVSESRIKEQTDNLGETGKPFEIKDTFHNSEIGSCRDHWEFKIKNFLTRSNEKWLLDQFNLWKKFLNQNSVEGHYDDFSHPAYDNFQHIRSLKAKLTDKERIRHVRRRFSSMLNQNFDVPENASASKKINSSQFSEIKLEVLKWDICALLRTIEEIENKVKMLNILHQTSSSDSKFCEKFIKHQFAMLNFSRNYIAIQYAQENPSNERNKLAI
jgi:hypothetical protein